MFSFESWQPERSVGAGPFVSRIDYRLPNGLLYTWTSRRHRKGFALQRGMPAGAAGTDEAHRLRLWVWAPRRIGWWIALAFMVGAACFAVASFASLSPGAVGRLGRDPTITNSVFFSGSIFFTVAAYLQLLETVNADRRAAIFRAEEPREKFRWFAWQPDRIGWLSAAIQLVGTVLFNINTLDALLPGLNWLQQDLVIWTPDMIGSVCFLVSSWLAVLEFCHSYWSWQVEDLSWWIVVVNLLGSVAFMVSAVYAVAGPGLATALNLWLVNAATLIGAMCFLLAAYLLVPEIALG